MSTRPGRTVKELIAHALQQAGQTAPAVEPSQVLPPPGPVTPLSADDAVRRDGSCQPSCSGTDALRRSFEDNIAEHFQATVLTAQASGSTVTARAELRSDRFRALGAERVISNFTVEVREGKIVLWSSTLDASDAQTAAYQAALRARAGQPGSTPAQLPRTGAAAVPDASPWLILGSLLVVVGIGVLRRRQAVRASR